MGAIAYRVADPATAAVWSERAHDKGILSGMGVGIRPTSAPCEGDENYKNYENCGN
jgi:hypothetical protein